MTLRVVRLAPEHLRQLRLQRAQQDMAEVLQRPEYGAALALSGPAFTVLADGQPIACIGLHEHHPGRAEAWALLGDDSGAHLRGITRAVAGYLQQVPYFRVEASVSATFVAGHRWARLLGFTQEGPARRGYLHDGSDVVTYVHFSGGAHGCSTSVHRAGGNCPMACPPVPAHSRAPGPYPSTPRKPNP